MITVNETDWFAFFLLWNDFRQRQGRRFRFGERELLGFGGFNWSFLDLTPMRDSDSKLLHENIDLRAPSKGQIDIKCAFIRCPWSNFHCLKDIYFPALLSP